ncbi:MAG: dipeptidase [Bacteroidota bacterium]
MYDRLISCWTLALVFLFSAACSDNTEVQEATTETQETVAEAQEVIAEVQPVAATPEELHERILTLDTHDDIPFNFATPEVDPGVEGDMQMDIPKMKRGKLDVGTFIVYVGQKARTPANYEKAKADAMIKFNAIHRMAAMYPDDIEVALTAADVRRIHDSGKLVAAIAIENGFVIGKDLSLLKKYKDLGAHYMTLAHNGHNDISDSCNPRERFGDGATEHNGISEFGEAVIAEMNRVGIMVDVSHISMEAAMEAARLSKAPIVASHSSVKGLHNVSRNMSDEAMLALKETGGVINIVTLDSFLKGGDNVTVSDLVDHIDYAVALLGIDYVGISSDFDGGGGVQGWNDASETPNVTSELVKRGYSEAEIAKLWSGNYLRAWTEAEHIATRMQAED